MFLQKTFLLKTQEWVLFSHMNLGAEARQNLKERYTIFTQKAIEWLYQLIFF